VFETTLKELDGITLRHFVSDDALRMVDLQRRTLAKCPDTSLWSAGFYYSPNFDQGQNIFCALGEDGAHVGHGFVYPAHINPDLDARLLWMDLRVDPALDDDVGLALRDLLRERVTARAQELAVGLDRRAMLYATYFSHGEASIAYILSRGYEPFERVLQLRRDLALAIPELPLPDGVTVRLWRMETEEEQRRYLDAYDAAFGDEGKRLEQLQHFMTSPMWAGGTTITAFDGDRVVGSVMAFFDPDCERNPGQAGSSEYIFVRPEWRRRGIARYLLAETLRYLKARDMVYASLEVLSQNARALALYESMGYERWRDEISFGLWLDGKEGESDVG
jgi:ribosomal protein S18 acetylase RimI-like enzyme